jgi:hypothetical protein
MEEWQTTWFGSLAGAMPMTTLPLIRRDETLITKAPVMPRSETILLHKHKQLYKKENPAGIIPKPGSDS